MYASNSGSRSCTISNATDAWVRQLRLKEGEGIYDGIGGSVGPVE